GSREAMLALALMIVIGIAAAVEALGMSPALGAFLAGMLLSESEYRHQIEVDIEPFKGLLLGIFFVTVGTTVDLSVVAQYVGTVLFWLVVLLVLKVVVLFAVARLFGVERGVAIEVAVLLAQAGEFAFVVIGIARDSNLLAPHIATNAIPIVAIGMMITPALAALARRAGKRLAAQDHAHLAPEGDGSEFDDHVVIGGFGRVGQVIARMLEAENVPFVALDGDAK